ncbi:MAG: DUF2029 domain-containing protein [Oligoflexia bacterium]|nr:DUF2029 domain-containing protein [Oligoflexia bacterium]
MSFNSKQLASVFALLFLGVLIFLRYDASLSVSLDSPSYPFFGAVDFVEYWSASRLAEQEKNPYDPAQMLEVQSQVRPGAEPLMMWNPPWLLPLIAPLMQLDFPAAVHVWLTINLVLALVIPLLLGSSFQLSILERLLLILLALTFPAFWFCAAHGQIGIMLTFFVTLAFCSLRHGYRFAAGLALSFLTIKAHLIYLVLLALFCCEVRARKFTVLLGLLCGVGLQALSCELIFPGLMSSWIRVMLHQSELIGAVPVTQWHTATLPSALAAWAASAELQFWARLAKLIPAFTALICANHLLFSARRTSRLEILFSILALSIFTAPFGWFFDQSMLFPVCALITVAAMRAGSLLQPMLCFYLLMIGWFGLYQMHQHHLAFWFPAGIVVLAWLAQPLARALWDEESAVVLNHNR